ncbi:MAG TPA: SRPBCC domain-containing protein [Saprospiraceae bacterium]|nr:SRPBCC domain-containing protein [Saprospiraceae bacterium]
MQNPDFNISFLVNQLPEEVFKTITNVLALWSEDLEGNSERLNDEFIYQQGEFHYSKHKLMEVNQFTKIVWLTLDSKLTLVKKNEWNESRLIFERTEIEDKIKLKITHVG